VDIMFKECVSEFLLISWGRTDIFNPITVWKFTLQMGRPCFTERS